MVPVGKVLATLPQCSSGRGRHPDRAERPLLARAVQDGGTNAARAQVRTDRRTHELDGDRCRVQVRHPSQHLFPEFLHVGGHRVQDRQALDRALRDELEEALPRLAAVREVSQP